MADRGTRRVHPAFLRPGPVLLVAAGGAVGSTVRYLLEAAMVTPAGRVPWVTFMINVSGAFLLGLLLTVLARSGDDAGLRRRLRLGVGTGALGGYTTYSTFAVEVWGLVGAGQRWAAFGYAVGSVLAGVAAATLGLLVARWLVPVRGRGEAQ